MAVKSREKTQQPSGTSEDDILTLLASNKAVWLETLTELDGAPTILEPYQARFLNDRSNFRLVNKSRQIGFSTVIAAEGVAKACMQTGYRANYVSVNQTEAADKIEIARNLYHSIPEELKEGDPALKPVLWTDAEHEISFHRPPNTSTLLSQPASSAIRGGRKDIYFDEFAHVRDAKKLYNAALPAITRGDSRLTIVSTPLGQSGLFYDIATDVASYPQYSRHSVPWWECMPMVREGRVLEAMFECPSMGTEERVRKWGTEKLVTIFESFGGDWMGFATEYEATFVDETTAYFPWELIVGAKDDMLPVWRELPVGWEPEGSVSIGVDLAKEKDQSVFTVVETVEVDGEAIRTVRFTKATQDDYDSQFNYLVSLAKRSRATRVSIDQTGVGQVFVERMKSSKVAGIVEGIVFTNAKKERWATQFKGDLQMDTVRLLPTTELLRQIHGVHRTKTEATGLYKFAGKHDDYFWSLMLALYGEGRMPARISFL